MSIKHRIQIALLRILFRIAVLCLGYPRVSKELKAFRDEMKEKYPADMVDELFAEVLPQL